ncbi:MULTISPECIES: type 1 glutamine amidotransferase domain-containing protein [Hyphobacterium]|uniref:Type 1 glutamine amidotransferase domain-containing protein n=1 Tax=Hyphobacterium vulgare TaxID=1736751 RepID=A0ABV7A0E8_9PROT
MKRWLVYGLFGVLALVALVGFGVPRALTAAGLHAHYEVPPMDLSGRRALIITTSHATLDPSGAATGVFASEMTAPYYAFLDAGMEVDIASIRGGAIPIEPASLRWPLISPPDRRFLDDPQFLSRVERSLEIELVDIEDYDIVFLAGGWGAAYDFAQSDALGDQISRAYAAGAVVGGVCHGPLGLLPARAPDGTPLVEGRRVTAVTDKQVQELNIEITPRHPERDLRAAGALFEAETAFRDFFATHVVVDGRIVTGQNQNSGAEAAHRMMEVVLTDNHETAP